MLTLDPQVIPSPIPVKLLRDDASYLIVGGTGGIGRCITRWMARSGARHIVLASRSGGDKPEILELIRELFASGVKVSVEKCDVTLPQDVSRLLTGILRDMPPIRGIIHGAMVVKVCAFYNPASFYLRIFWCLKST